MPDIRRAHALVYCVCMKVEVCEPFTVRQWSVSVSGCQPSRQCLQQFHTYCVWSVFHGLRFTVYQLTFTAAAHAFIRL